MMPTCDSEFIINRFELTFKSPRRRRARYSAESRAQDKFELEKADQFNHRVSGDLNNTNEFAARRAAQRATPRHRVAREVGAAVRWLVWEFGPWGGQEEPLPVMVERVVSSSERGFCAVYLRALVRELEQKLSLSRF